MLLVSRLPYIETFSVNAHYIKANICYNVTQKTCFVLLFTVWSTFDIFFTKSRKEARLVQQVSSKEMESENLVQIFNATLKFTQR